MRQLTIRREKRFTACLAKMSVYIQDDNASELMIGDIPCRKLGVVANGKEATFSIGDEAARIYVIADKMSRGYCNDFYELPAGSEDVTLTGRNIFNPANGNAFRFDNNTSEAALENRRRANNRGLVVLLCAVAIGLGVGFCFGVAAYLGASAVL